MSELMHYGVLGMKWGVRKNPAKAYAKASIKRKRLEKSAEVTKSNREYAQNSYDKAKRARLSTEEQMSTAEKKATAAGRVKERADADAFLAEQSGKGFFKNMRRQETKKAAEKATDDYNQALGELTRISKQYQIDLSNEEVASDTLAYYSSVAARAASRSERWNKTMDAAFKDVPADVIAAGEELVQKRMKRSNK